MAFEASSSATCSAPTTEFGASISYSKNQISACIDQNMTMKENEVINLELADFFFGCNIPFAVVESTHFRKLFQKIRPSYKIPTRTTLSTTLLDKSYDRLWLDIQYYL